MEKFTVVLTAIQDLYAVWNTEIEDYETTGTLKECETFCLKNNS